MSGIYVTYVADVDKGQWHLVILVRSFKQDPISLIDEIILSLSVSVLESELMNYPSTMYKNTVMVVAIAIFIWVSWYI